MKQKYIYLLFLWLFALGLSAQINDKISIAKEDFHFVKVNGYDRIQCKIKDRTSGVGNPELPAYRVSYVLPVDATVTDPVFPDILYIK